MRNLKRIVFLHFLCALSFLLIQAGCFLVPSFSGSDGTDPFAGRVAAALALAGGNRENIEAFLAAYPEGEKHRAARFLVANMPAADLSSLSAGALEENLDTAFRARDEMPWGRTPAFEVFLHYVLPYRVTQERADRWRPRFYEELKKAVSGCSSMEQAAVRVNRWCAARVRFKQTEFRDQSPLDTLRSGYGRCEEMMIISICAARSVGLPARPCSTPWWTFCDNNHAWVEVWADGAWHYTGGCESSDRLDKAWFSAAAERAGMVKSVMFGTPGGAPTEDAVYRTAGKAALINSTAVYACTGRLEILVLGPGGKPAAGCPMAVSVCNYQALRAVARLESDGKGRAAIELGVGGFFLSAGDERGRAYAVVQTRPGEDLPVTLRLEPSAVPPESFWLKLPTPAEAERMKTARDAARGAGRARRPFAKLPPLPPPPPRDEYTPGAMPELEALMSGGKVPASLRAVLKDAGAGWRVVARAVLDLPAERREDAAAFLERTTHLDRLEITGEVITDHVLGAAGMPSGAGGTAPPQPLPKSSLYRDFVLKAGIDREHLAPWRRLLRRAFSSCLKETPSETARAVLDLVKARIEDREWDYLAPEMNPLETWTSGHGLSSEKAVLAVAALRALGIPARKTPNRNAVMFHDGKSWREEELAAGGSAPGGTGAGGAGKEETGRIVVCARREGKALSGFDDFEVSTFAGGGWNPLRTLSVSKEGERSIVALPAGEYLVTTKVRNGNGDPFVRTRQVVLGKGGEARVSWDVDLPADAGVFAFEVVRPLEKMPAVVLEDVSGRRRDLREAASKGPLLLFFFTSGDEPSRRMFPLVAKAAALLSKKTGAAALAVLLPAPGGGTPDLSSFPSPGHFPLCAGSVGAGRAFGLPFDPKEGRFTKMPSVLLAGRGGKPVLWMEGYDLEIGKLLESAARVVR